MCLVHDRYLGEAFLYIIYAFFTGLLLFRFHGPLRRFGGDTFLVSVVLLGLSVLTDALQGCLLYTSPSPRDATLSRMPSSA